MTVREFLKKGAEILGVSLSELAGRGRSKPVLRAREILAVTGVELYHLRVKDIAEEVRKHPVTASTWVMRGRRLRQQNSQVKKKIRALDLALIERS